MWAPLIISGFTAGAAGSMHCAGMCGPLSLALPVHGLTPARKFTYLLLYQFGRIITYSTLGWMVGLAGRMIYTSGFQQWFSITAGILVLIAAAGYFLQKQIFRINWLNGLYSKLRLLMGQLLHSNRGASGFLFLGMANGLLPCGMVYVALVVSASFTEALQSAGFMAMFGLGTLPVMMLIAYAGHLLNPAVRHSMRRVFPVFVALMGVLLILRGLNLGIPFISPHLPGPTGDVISCPQ